MVATFYSWLFEVLELELEFRNLFLIISKQREEGSEILAPLDVKLYCLSNGISSVKNSYSAICCRETESEVCHVRKSVPFGQYEKKHAVEVWKNIYAGLSVNWNESSFLNCILRFSLFSLEHSKSWQSVNGSSTIILSTFMIAILQALDQSSSKLADCWIFESHALDFESKTSWNLNFQKTCHSSERERRRNERNGYGIVSGLGFSRDVSAWCSPTVTFVRELLCLNRVGPMLNITSQWQDPEILLLFFAIRVYYEKLGRMQKPFVSKVRSDLSVTCLHFRGMPRKF